MIRDRLKALQLAAQQYEDSDDNFNIRNHIYENTAIEIEDENAGYAQYFFKEVEQIREWIEKINENVESMRTLHSKLLSSPRSDESAKNELEVRTETVKQLSKNINVGLKALERKIHQEETDLGTEMRRNIGLRIRRTQHSTTLQLFLEAISKFNNVQVDYKEKCEERIQRVVSIAKAVITDEKIEELLEQGNYGSIFSGDIITETKEVQRALEDVQIRHQELIRLEKSIQELRDLFVEMFILVDQQGELIDRIETHVNNAGEHVETAKIQTKKAIRYQKKSRLKKLLLFAIILIIVLIALSVIIYYSSNGSSSQPTPNTKN